MVSKQEQYETLPPQARALLEGESDPVARMANLAALIHTTFGFWWTGFYRVCPATDAPGYETADASHGKPDGQQVVNQGNIGGPDDTSRERTDGQNSAPEQGHEILGGQKDADEGKDERHAGEVLLLGPFQGPVACTRIAYGRGVCGTAWKERRTIVVPDVEAFPGHIACSALSRSEIVVPIFARPTPGTPATGTQIPVIAVLDIDSERLATFDDTDARYLEQLVALL